MTIAYGRVVCARLDFATTTNKQVVMSLCCSKSASLTPNTEMGAHKFRLFWCLGWQWSTKVQPDQYASVKTDSGRD